MIKVVSTILAFILLHVTVGQAIVPSDSLDNKFSDRYYLNLQGGLGFYSSETLMADGDLRLYMGKKINPFINPGIAIGYDSYLATSFLLIPVNVNLRVPLTEKFYLNIENGYAFPKLKNHINDGEHSAQGGYSGGISIGSASGSDLIKWHLSMGVKYQHHKEERMFAWSQFPTKYEYKLTRVFVRLGFGI